MLYPSCSESKTTSPPSSSILYLSYSLLYLMPLFKSPDGDNDAGYAISSYREVDPELGTMEELQLAFGAFNGNETVSYADLHAVDHSNRFFSDAGHG